MGRKIRLTMILALVAMLAPAACEQLPTGPDTEPPTVTITSPSDGSTATDSVTVSVVAQDNVGVVLVQLYVSGRNLPIAEATQPPFSAVVPLVDVDPGVHTLVAVAIDAAGNADTSDQVSFTAQRTPGLKFVSQFSISGNAVDVAAANDVAYVAAGDGGIVAIDISNVFIPRFEARFRTGSYVEGIAVDNLTVYAAATDGGIFALSAGTADTLILFSELDTQGFFAQQLAVSPGRLSVAGGSGGMLQLNTAVADTLIEMGIFNRDTDIQDVEVVGNYAYTAEGYAGMRVIDISAADTMVGIYRFASAQQANNLAMAGNFAYLADGDGGVLSFNIGDPTNPIYLSTFNNGRLITGVAVDGRWVFAAGGDPGVDVIDADAPHNLLPAPSGNFNTAGYAKRVAVYNGYVLVADSEWLTILKYVP